MRRTLPALMLALLVSPAIAGDFSAKVIGISDGDTLTGLRQYAQDPEARALRAIEAGPGIVAVSMRMKAWDE